MRDACIVPNGIQCVDNSSKCPPRFIYVGLPRALLLKSGMPFTNDSKKLRDVRILRYRQISLLCHGE